MQSKDNRWGQFCKDLLSNGFSKPRKGYNAGDHPPITPVAWASSSRLAGNEKRIYEFIVRYFIATVSPDCEIDSISATFQIEDEIFHSSGQVIKVRGFLDVAPWFKVDEFEFPKDIKKGDFVPIQRIKLVESKTEPPPFLTESELIALMEKHGIGTDASIPQHIANICEREYAAVDQKTRSMKPTQLGMFHIIIKLTFFCLKWRHGRSKKFFLFVSHYFDNGTIVCVVLKGLLLGHGYYKIDPQLVLPELRAYMERNMTAVAKGQLTKTAIIKSVLDIFAAKFDYFVHKFEKMDKMFDHLYNNPANLHGGKFLSKCGICNRKMKLFRARGPPKLYCENCKEQYVLPKGEVKPVEKECPLSKFQIVKFSKDNKADYSIKITYPISPFEFMHSPSNIYDPERPLLKRKKRAKNRKRNKGGNNSESANVKDLESEYKYTTADGQVLDIEEINPDKLKKEMGCNRCWYAECDFSVVHNMVKPCPKCNARV